MGQRDEPEQFQNAPYAYWTLREVIRNEELTLEERSGAVSELEKLGKGGDCYSQYLLGKLWRDGPLLIPDGVNARYWFEQAARQGHLAAQYALAKLYLSADLEVRDTAQGVDWLHTAAECGNSWAMYRLGKELLRGDIMEKDTAGAVKWFTRSAEGGNPYAQYLLGKLYLMGKEVPRDKAQAVLWLTRSAEQGNEYARYLLDHREEQRPPDVMLAVTRLLYHMSRIFQDNSLPRSRPGGIQIDRKRLRKLREKKIAQGHKPDDHEEQQPEMTMQAAQKMGSKTRNKILSAGRVERNPMKRSKYNSFNELPLMLTVQDVADVLGIGLAHAYEVAHRKDFPTITLGSRIIVPRDKLMAWIEEQAARKTEIF